MSKYGVFSGPYFPVFGLNTEIISVFSPNAGKYGPEKNSVFGHFTRWYFYQNQIYNSEIFFIESRTNIWVILEKNIFFHLTCLHFSHANLLKKYLILQLFSSFFSAIILFIKISQKRSYLVSHCVKSVHGRSYSGPHFSAFGLNTERRDTPYLSVFSPNAGRYEPE